MLQFRVVGGVGLGSVPGAWLALGGLGLIGLIWFGSKFVIFGSVSLSTCSCVCNEVIQLLKIDMLASVLSSMLINWGLRVSDCKRY